MSTDGISRPVVISISDFSDLQKERLKYAPSFPAALSKKSVTSLSLGEPTVTRSSNDEATLSSWFPKTNGQPIVSLIDSSSSSATAKPIPSSPIRVGVVFAGRPAPGGHCVVTGLFDFLAERAPGSTLLGFISGTKGLFEQSSLELTSSLLESYRNQVRIYSLYSIIPHRLIQAFTH
jgi:diphosphate-dependent phosphofructokinase